ncbi:hypothetical protein MOPEL_130_00930 [Mobilicoccus pelagius NBRC 104925]|uniref:Uncharacterized protein n=1 Tax=Mobilicoccus pelagius NBRC 104925 TaxID=1089455 RepID=H5UUS8_9MICO|nr:hypothetical protein MOPEL_130_00930 [Mobilicoccus pelagius NBRC 104925]
MTSGPERRPGSPLAPVPEGRGTGAALVDEVTGLPHERGAGAVLLEAAPHPASAEQTVGHDPDVPHLGADTVGAPHEVALGDDATADARADREEDEVLDVTGGAVDELAPRRRVRVVLEDDRQPDEIGESCTERFVTPGDVRGEQHPFAGTVEEPGDRDADGGHVVAVDEFPREVRRRSDDPLGVLRRGLPPGTGEDLPARRDEGAEDLRPADVEADGGARRPTLGGGGAGLTCRHGFSRWSSERSSSQWSSWSPRVWWVGRSS